MKKKIAILGSTGSIGKTLLDIIRKDRKNFEIVLLTADVNYKLLLKQAKEFKVKNLIIANKKIVKLLKQEEISQSVNILSNFNNFSKIFKKKIDYTMSSITGINGLEPTLNIIKYSKKIAIANKESIICGWNLINKELKKNKTQFIPVDSEHFSLWFGLQNLKIRNIEIQKATKNAIDVPFKIMHVCLESCDLLLAMAKKGNPNSISDVGVGMYCIHAAVHGAYLNVRINSKELKDKKIVKKVDVECQKIIKKINSKTIEIQSIVDKKL